jgi:hypothetical protein
MNETNECIQKDAVDVIECDIAELAWAQELVDLLGDFDKAFC